ncbi:MAG: DUF4019 domain-containing protein [Acidobacteria bacterium]|nr:DUF4019 domain-containing protein [Acidobacteriota bacterium]
MNKINAVCTGIILLFVSLSCSTFIEGNKLAGAAVENFHTQFNKKNFGAIYEGADDEFKKSVTEKEWTELLAAVHRKLGTVKESSSAGWKVNTTTAGTFANLNYEVEFSEGKGTEEFVFVIKDDKALLYNYRVNSPLLITK